MKKQLSFLISFAISGQIFGQPNMEPQSLKLPNFDIPSTPTNYTAQLAEQDCSRPASSIFPTGIYDTEVHSTCQIDSTLAIHSGSVTRFTYHYNNLNQYSGITFEQLWGQDWRYDIREIHVYDMNGNKAELLRQVWDNGYWRNSLRWVFTYNEQNKLTETVDQIWVSNSYQNSSRILNIYDASGNLIETVQESWNGGDWQNSENHSYSYNESGCMSQCIWTLVGQPYRRYQYTFNNNHLLINERVQNWGDSLWVDLEEYIMEYNSNDSITVNSFNQSLGSSWHTFFRTFYSYDANGAMIQQIIQFANPTDTSLADRYIYTYTNNENSQRTSVTRIEKDLNSGEWSNIDKQEFEYDDYGNMIKLSYAIGEDDVWYPWDNDYMYYDCYGTGIEEQITASSLLSIAPNPSTAGFQLSLSKGVMHSIRLVDPTGRVVLSQTFATGTTATSIATAGIAPGVYFATVTTDKGVAVQRVVVQ